jgi:hypothetical protein
LCSRRCLYTAGKRACGFRIRCQLTGISLLFSLRSSEHP